MTPRSEYQAEWQRRNPLRQRAAMVKCSARQRAEADGVPFDPSLFEMSVLLTYFQSCDRCMCCGRKLDYSVRRGPNRGPHDDAQTLDRLVPAKGYVTGNIVLLCWRCNNLKRNATVAELETVVRFMKECGLDRVEG